MYLTVFCSQGATFQKALTVKKAKGQIYVYGKKNIIFLDTLKQIVFILLEGLKS